ncbi:hypothetical protein DQ04_11011030, partial [Trypanosoma grayi]|uniref:hypothetical protein n=1 Tax=Trypanosoma grayi TaxID=71804 RepID=UPI0004F415CE
MLRNPFLSTPACSMSSIFPSHHHSPLTAVPATPQDGCGWCVFCVTRCCYWWHSPAHPHCCSCLVHSLLSLSFRHSSASAMAHRRLRGTARACACCLFLLAIMIGFQQMNARYSFLVGECPFDEAPQDPVAEPRTYPTAFDNHSLQYVPRSVVRTWGERDFLVVLAIPSIE